MVTRVDKFLTALAGTALEAVNLGLLPAGSRPWVSIGVFFLTALGVYIVPNRPAGT